MSLCFLSIKGNVLANGLSHKNIHYATIQRAESEERLRSRKQTHINHDFSVLKNNSFDDRKEDVLRIEEEDNTEESNFIKKHILAVQYCIALAYASIYLGFNRNSKKQLPVYANVNFNTADKYILQRVLRI